MGLFHFEKSRLNPKLVPQRRIVTREGTVYATTLWVNPNKPTAGQLDIFAEAEILQARAVDNLKPGATVRYLFSGKQAVGIISSASAGMYMVGSRSVPSSSILEVLAETDSKKIHSLIAEATPENRSVTEAMLFGASQPEKPKKPAPYEFVPTETIFEGMETDDYRGVDISRIGLIPDTALDSHPTWIPPLTDKLFESLYNRVGVVKLGPDDYMMVGPGQKYFRCGVDVLACTQDFYMKRAKRDMAIKNKERAAKYPDWKGAKQQVKMLSEIRVANANTRLLRSLGVPTGYTQILNAIADMKQKMLDMNLQVEEDSSSYYKGQETSYGDKGTRPDLLERYGVLVKRQNGDSITKTEVEDISTALDKVFGVFGDRSSMARIFGLKISHSGKVLMHARKAYGIFSARHRAIGVTMQTGATGFGFTLSHEWAHFMDNYLGTKQKRHFASDDWDSTAGKVAKAFRSSMREAQKSDYQNRTCECFARALEQYFATVNGEADEYQADRNGNGNHPTRERFEAVVRPLVEDFFRENDELLKALNKTGLVLKPILAVRGGRTHQTHRWTLVNKPESKISVLSGNFTSKGMTTNADLVEVQRILKDKEWGCKAVGIRIVDKGYDGYNSKIGEVLPKSHKWKDGEWTDKMINGTSSIAIDAKIKPVTYSGYMGRRILVIGSDKFRKGEDVGEIVIQNAKVLAIYDLPSNTAKSLTWSGYKLQGRTKIHSMDISIENKKGSVRRGVDPDGHAWETKMHYAYGYIRGTVGKDKDHLDCFIGPNPESRKVFIVHQNNPDTGEYDEDKIMLGFLSRQDAKRAYLGQYDRPGFFGSMDETDIETFKTKAFKDSSKGKKLIVR